MTADLLTTKDWLAYCLAKPGAWEDQPWEDHVVVKVAEKIFAFFGDTSIGLTCGDRESADLWLDRYPEAASKMAYIGAHGWNNFRLDGSIADDELAELVDGSYALVVAKLPRKRRPVAS